MTIKFRIVFLQGPREVAAIEGRQAMDGDKLTVADLDQIIPTEQLLERLLGFRVHIEQVDHK